LHRNAQRLLRPLAVVNPYADRLSFLSDKTRTRRDHEKYLTLIDAIALLHQHQRDVKKIVAGTDTGTSAGTGTNEPRIIEYVEVTLDDIEAANRLAHEVLGRSTDELPPQTRALLAGIASMVKERSQAQVIARSEIRFTRRELREIADMSDTQLKVHLARLVELEYLLTHRAERGQGHVYELLYDGGGGAEPHLSGLIDVAKLAAFGAYDGERPGAKAERSAPGRGVAGARSGGGRTAQNGESIDVADTCADSTDDGAKTHILEGKKAASSYTNGTSHTHARARASSSLAASSLAARR